MYIFYVFLFLALIKFLIIVCTHLYFSKNYDLFKSNRINRNKKNGYFYFLVLNFSIFDPIFLIETLKIPNIHMQILKSIATVGLLILCVIAAT